MLESVIRGDGGDRDLLTLLYQGLDDATVARRLGVSHRTVQRRVQRIMSDLGVSGRFALGAKAQELGLILDITPAPHSRDGRTG
ncbi:response regulator transcription factor [Streptomyces sp. NPDC048584]